MCIGILGRNIQGKKEHYLINMKEKILKDIEITQNKRVLYSKVRDLRSGSREENPNLTVVSPAQVNRNVK